MVTITLNDVKDFAGNHYKKFIYTGVISLSFLCGMQCQKGRDLNGNVSIDGYKATVVGDYVFAREDDNVKALRIFDVYHAFQKTKTTQFNADGSKNNDLEEMIVTGKAVELKTTTRTAKFSLTK